MQATSRIGLPAGTKDVRLERIDSDTCHFWKLWLSFDRNMEHGTFLALYDDGSIERITHHPDGWEQVMKIKPASREVASSAMKGENQVEEELRMGMHVVISIIDNFGIGAVYGPFAHGDEAVEWAERNMDDQYWMIKKLNAAKEGENDE